MSEETRADSDSPMPGRRLPDAIAGYRIQRVLGTGGMATVYAALQKQPRRTVALKVIKAGVETRAAAHRFKREIEILGKLTHPNIAQVFEAGTYDDGAGHESPYFVMEYVPGAKTVLEYAEDRNLSLRQRLRLFVRICAAIDHGHRTKVIHRDIKPSNILVDEKGTPKVIDFGIARSIDQTADPHTMQTEAGKLLGTIHYMAPEQLQKAPVDLDPRCDVYALGAVLYKLLTGKPSHDLVGLPLPTAALMVVQEDPTPLSSRNPELRGDLETIVHKALARARNDRYKTAGSMGRDILRYLERKPIQARPATLPYKTRLLMQRHRRMFIVATAAVVVIAAAVVIILLAASEIRERQADEQARLDQERERLDAERQRIADEEAAEVIPDAAALFTAMGTLEGHGGRVVSLEFSAGGERLTSGATDGAVRHWHVSGARQLYGATDHGDSVHAVAASADGMIVATTGADGSLAIVDGQRGRLLNRVGLSAAVIHDIDVADDGTLVAVAGDDLTARVYDVNAEAWRTFRGSTGQFLTITLSPDGTRLAAGAERGAVYVWSIETGRRLERFDELTTPVLGITFVDDATVLAVDTDGMAMQWTLGSESESQVVVIPPNGIRHAAIDRTSRWMAWIDGDGAVMVWDLHVGAQVGGAIPVHADAATCLAIDARSGRLAVGHEHGAIRMYRLTAE